MKIRGFDASCLRILGGKVERCKVERSEGDKRC